MAVLLVLGSEGCGRTVPPPRVACGTCEAPHRFVRVQRHILDAGRNGSGGLDHPFSLNQQEWRVILKTVQVQRLGMTFFLFPLAKELVEPAFTTDEIEYLSSTLPRAFAEAQRDDWVVFALGRPRDNNLTMVTTGAWYVKESVLYFVLANFDAGVSMPMIRAELDRDPLYDIAGSPPFQLIPNDFMKKASVHKSLRGFFRSKPPTIAIDYKELLVKPQTPSTVEVRDKGEKGPVMQESVSPPVASSLEERLEQLKRLKKRGLITEEDYERKKKEWLDQL